MALILTIENERSLTNGSPVSVRVPEKGNLNIGRGSHLDWPLPDPTRFISGKHCEIRYRDDAYWIYDVSTNGTFLNDSPRRLHVPHRLSNGDRLTIGTYIVLVTIDADREEIESDADADIETSNDSESWAPDAAAMDEREAPFELPRRVDAYQEPAAEPKRDVPETPFIVSGAVTSPDGAEPAPGPAEIDSPPLSEEEAPEPEDLEPAIKEATPPAPAPRGPASVRSPSQANPSFRSRDRTPRPDAEASPAKAFRLTAAPTPAPDGAGEVRPSASPVPPTRR